MRFFSEASTSGDLKKKIGLVATLFVLLGLVVFGTYYEFDYQEATTEAKFVLQSGAQVVAKDGVNILGIAEEPNGPIRYFLLEGGVGFDGWEVKLRQPIVPGSSFMIKKVLKSRYPFSPLIYEVEGETGVDTGKRPVRIRVNGNPKLENLGLDSRYFEAITGTNQT